MKVKNVTIGFFSSIGFLGLSLISSITYANTTQGARIYCMMREAGNEHESSWQAAYAAIKQSDTGIFKTSPRQAASKIVQEVTMSYGEGQSNTYQNCAPYLGDLFPGKKKKEKAPKPPSKPKIKVIYEGEEYSPSKANDTNEEKYSY